MTYENLYIEPNDSALAILLHRTSQSSLLLLYNIRIRYFDLNICMYIDLQAEKAEA